MGCLRPSQLVLVALVLLNSCGNCFDSFLHVTDVHLDLLYNEGSDPRTDHCESRKPGSAGHYGDYLCQSPTPLVKGSLDAMQSILPDPAFILFTGDFRRGYDGENKADVLALIKITTNMLKAAFPWSSVIPCLGNHDTAPRNAMDPKNDSWLFDSVAEMWGEWLPYEAKETFRKGGYYFTTVHDTNFIVLNTCMYYLKNEATIGEDDPGAQFTWLRQILTELRNIGQKAYVVGHCTPSFFDFYPYYNTLYLNIFREHADTVVAHFYGHLHRDMWYILYNDTFYDNPYSVPVGMMFVGPSIFPDEHNPSFRIYQKYEDSHLLSGFSTYFANLTSANLHPDDPINYEVEYSSTDSPYDLPSPLTPGAMDELYSRMLPVGSDAFQAYHRWYWVQGPKADEPCGDICQNNFLCQITCLEASAAVLCEL